MDYIILTNLPMPPSVNNAFFNRKDGLGRAKSGAYRLFERQVAAWAVTNARKLGDLQNLISNEAWLQVDANFCFPRTSLVAKSGRPKRLDVDNRLKILNDALAKTLGFDDCRLASQRIEKIGLEKNASAHVNVRVSPLGYKLLSACPLQDQSSFDRQKLDKTR